MPIALVFISVAACAAIAATVWVRQATAAADLALAGLSITLPPVL